MPYLTGTCYDKYGFQMEEACNIIVSELNGSFVTTTTSSGNGDFNITVSGSIGDKYIVTFYKTGDYGLDNDISGACFMTTVSGV